MAGLFENKVIIVTGGGGAIGRAAALGFAAAGGKVAVADLVESAASATVEIIRGAGGEAMAIAGDMSQAADVEAMVEKTVHRYGQLDCAFNNAGITHPHDAAWDESVFRKIIDTNLISQMLCLKFEIPRMLARGKGAICNMSSVLGLVGQRAPVVQGYSASKHAIIGLTKTAALQYAASNIRINALCPGVTRSPIVDAAMSVSEELRAHLSNYAPLRGIAEPAEIAEAAIWLCSDKASFVTGHSLVADGGYTAQ
ncbi:MAG TPA: SDR family oxidoreductase [Steroidobacteraceae bacterium]|nr:SDR family oxidoreductase [Steroidobacteraceae bacterium]